MLSIMTKGMEEEGRSFAKDLRSACVRYRTDKGLTQQDMGELLGVSRGTIGNFERGCNFLGEAGEFMTANRA